WVIFDNALIKQLSNVPRLFRLPYAARPTEAGFYRPVTMTSYALTYAISGPDVRGFHAANLLLHAACSALVVALALRLGPASGLAAPIGLASPERRRALLVATLTGGALFVAALTYFALRKGAGPGGGLEGGGQYFVGRPASAILAAVVRVLFEYARILFFPHPL